MLLKKKIINKKAVIGVIGLGYVGLPFIINAQRKGYEIYGFDTNKKKILNLKKKISHIPDVSKKDLKNLNKNNLFSLSQINKVKICDILIICLPTPLTKKLTPDMSYLNNCCKNILPFLKEHQLLIIESTVYPGATKKIFISKISKKFDIGKNFYIGYSPERINPGDIQNSNISKITKVISGETEECLKHVELIYKRLFEKIYRSKNISTAEFAKLYENSFRSVNISFANEMKMICDKIGINILDVIKISKTKTFGFTPFYPGPGMGGHCVPIDPLFISWVAKKKNINANFIESSRKINFKVTNWIINKVNNFISKKAKIKILLIGVAYKKNVNDSRESPGVKILDYFSKKKINITYFDPHVRDVKIGKKHVKSLKILNYRNLKKYTTVIVCTNHDGINFKKILQFSKKIFDTRGIYNPNKKVIFC